jgi:hypothetical protein
MTSVTAADTSGHGVRWTTLQASGPRLLATSDHERAVSDDRYIYGRWPRTEEGKRYANQTFETNSKTLAHGVAYAVSGRRDPAAVGLRVECLKHRAMYRQRFPSPAPGPVAGTPSRLRPTVASASKKDVKKHSSPSRGSSFDLHHCNEEGTLFSLAVTRIQREFFGCHRTRAPEKSTRPAPPKFVGKRTIKPASTAGNCFPPFHSCEMTCL